MTISLILLDVKEENEIEIEHGLAGKVLAVKHAHSYSSLRLSTCTFIFLRPCLVLKKFTTVHVTLNF